LKKNDKVIIIFYIFLVILFTGVTFYYNSIYDTTPLPDVLPKPIKEIKIITESNIEKNKIFLTMTNLENYPKILLNNIKSVDILEQGNSTAIAEFYVIEKGIGSKILAKQTIYPYSKHVIEVIDGDAKGTKITQIFTEKNSITTIDTKIDLNFKGILSVFAYLPRNNLEHASNTVVSTFIDYAEFSDNKTKKIIDDIYREILLRPADQEAFQYWGSLLENNLKTEEEIRTEILNSDEKKHILSLNKIKGIDELKIETKKIIDDIYREILLRPADQEAFQYWGSLLENKKMDRLEIRKNILKSQESLDLKRFDLTTRDIKDLFEDILEREPTFDELTSYKYLIDIEEITLNKIKLELKKLQNDEPQ